MKINWELNGLAVRGIGVGDTGNRYEVAIQEMMGGKFQATVTNERLQQISPKKAGDLRAVTEFAYEQVARIEKRVKEQEEMERQCDASQRTLLAEVKLMAAEIESS